MPMLTVADIKTYLRYQASDTSQDDPLTIMLNGGRRHIENLTGHLLAPREVVETPNAFPVAPATGALAWYELRWRPFEAGSLVIAYLDADQAPQTCEDFTTYLVTGSTRVIPASAWPSALAGVSLTYTAGYGDADQVPEDLMHALALYCGMSDADRATQSGAAWSAIDNLLEYYRLPVLV